MRLIDFEHDSAGNLIGVTVEYDGETIELERVRHGYWTNVDNTFTKFQCSECGRIEHTYWERCRCGAIMDGGRRK
jgi:peptide methionine sulfoxide reductase MsrA